MSELLSLALSVLVLISSMVVQSTRASCPSGWELYTGVDRGGAFVCQPARIGCEYSDRICEQPPGYIAGRIYCGPGSEPAQTRYGDGARCTRQPPRT